MLNKNGIKEGLSQGIYVDSSQDKIGENYITVTLSNMLKTYETPLLETTSPNPSQTILIPETGFILEPNKLYLGSTNEYTKTDGYVPVLSGLLELATLGMEIHITAGFGDNGFEGTWTLEIICSNPTVIYPNMEIGRVYYYPLIGDDKIKYCGKYFGQIDPTESRLAKEYVKRKEK